MKILVLGHNGMLGHMVCKYFKSLNLTIETTPFRWPDIKFKENIKNSNCDFLVNCIAAIPQKKYIDYIELNVKFPIWLAKNFRGNIITPSTDGEYCGDIPIDDLYSKTHPRDAYDDYGLSKACGSAILIDYDNVKQIRTSINGPELNDSGYTLFSWFRNQKNEVKCINNHYWSGVTSLEWSKNALKLINNWSEFPKLVQLSTKCITKLELLTIINEVFELKKTIIPISGESTINRCLQSDYEIKNLRDQFIELKKFYYGI